MGEHLDYPSVSHISSVAQVCPHFVGLYNGVKTLNMKSRDDVWRSAWIIGWPLSRKATSILCLLSRRTMRQRTRRSQGADFEINAHLTSFLFILSEIPGQAHVAVLEPDATNIINVVEGGYEGITTSIQVTEKKQKISKIIKMMRCAKWCIFTMMAILATILTTSFGLYRVFFYWSVLKMAKCQTLRKFWH